MSLYSFNIMYTPKGSYFLTLQTNTAFTYSFSSLGESYFSVLVLVTTITAGFPLVCFPN